MKLNHMLTRQGENLSKIPWNVYPRPQLKRDSFFCLNGEWNFYFNNKQTKILVPFSPESKLSGVMETCEECVYKREFSLPENFIKDKVFLHFGAVDQIARVYLNGEFVGEHIGGYEHFFFDITAHLKENNEITVKVTDKLDKTLPYGKQTKKRGGMWYTKTTGIWQTVWIESVSESYIKAIDIKADDKKATITVDGAKTGVAIFEDKRINFDNSVIEYTPQNIELWSPENPKLYYFTIETEQDKIESYLAFRKLQIKEVNNIPRLLLNGKPYFFNGVLDQGYYSDGILTPASEENYIEDILLMKEAGFNMLRKHIKVESELFYYHCDRLGMAVFQDMVNNGNYSFFFDTALPTVFMQKFPDKILHLNKKSRSNFEQAMIQTVNSLKNHPSIVYWTIFNEGWGQFGSARMYETLKKIDSTRFIDSTSGWFRGKKTDVESLHVYFKKLKAVKSDKPIVISEFGGYVLKTENHIFNENKEYGYKTLKDKEEFNLSLLDLFENQLLPLVKQGVCASVYTQVSDVEDEINGLVTYDRKVKKYDHRLKEINMRIFEEISK